ncbi:ECs_2282 family putative zinc-binding protein [Paenibacillus taichungensis]|uniref:ECs_2282 family putative zinc-binding protein n=1 Tax=Paenibacillus taichungensis TaxID=484184 RepID=UPI0039A7326D
MDNLEKNIKMFCRTCGNDQFSILDECIYDLQSAPNETKIKCSDCGLVTTKEELIEDNSHIIAANFEDLKKEAIKKLEKELKNLFK